MFVFQADLQSTLGDKGYIIFGVILFVWELLPTSLVVFFFRVRKPDLDRVRPPLTWFDLLTGMRMTPSGTTVFLFTYSEKNQHLETKSQSVDKLLFKK